MPALDSEVLLAGVRGRFVGGASGLQMRMLEAGSPKGRSCLLLLRGFPAFTYSWLRIMPPLA